MTRLSHNGRRQRRRLGRHVMPTDLFTLDLTPEEILADLEPNWFQSEGDSETNPVEQVRIDEAAA